MANYLQQIEIKSNQYTKVETPFKLVLQNVSNEFIPPFAIAIINRQTTDPDFKAGNDPDRRQKRQAQFHVFEKGLNANEATEEISTFTLSVMANSENKLEFEFYFPGEEKEVYIINFKWTPLEEMSAIERLY